MKRKTAVCFLVLAFAVICLLSGVAQADSVKVQEGNFTFQISLGTAQIIKYEGNDTRIVIPSTVEFDGVENRVNTIGNYVFQKNEQLEEVVIPATVTKLGIGAFQDCISLKSVTIQGDIPESAPAFVNTGSLSGGFTVCFESGVTAVPDSIFSTTSEKYRQKYAFVKRIVMADTVKEIGYRAFEGCHDLTDIEWSAGLETIGSAAFRNCTGLKELELPGKTKTIGLEAFTGCERLETVVLPDSVKTLDVGVFKNCVALTDVTVHCNFNKCSESFYNTGSLSGGYTVRFGNGVTEVPSRMFYTGVEEKTEKFAYVRKVIFPNSLKKIGGYAFKNCYLLDEISWGSGLTTIDMNAFDNNRSLVNLKVPAPVKEIAKEAFKGCAGLRTIILPSSLQKLGLGAFTNCVNLEEVTINGNIAANSALTAFSNTGSESGGYNVYFGKKVTEVPYGLFYSSSSRSNAKHAYVRKVVLSNKTETIGKSAFRNCYSLEQVVFGSGIKSILNDAFNGCDALSEAYYPGTPSQWDNNVKISSNNQPLLDASMEFGAYDPETVTLNKTKKTLKIGQKVTLKAALQPDGAVTALTWSSSDPSVATVSKSGTVKAVGKGKAVITAATDNGLTAKCTVTVKAPLPTKITLNKTGTVTLAIGKKLTLKAAMKPAGAESKLTWGSSKPAIASVSSKGVVKALKKGTTVITVTTSNGISKTVKIKVQ